MVATAKVPHTIMIASQNIEGCFDDFGVCHMYKKIAGHVVRGDLSSCHDFNGGEIVSCMHIKSNLQCLGKFNLFLLLQITLFGVRCS